MKVYVSELPKSCDNCPCFYDESISCQASDKWLPLDEEDNFSRSTQRHPTCPLQCLSDYTKQVRKEVAEEIKKKVLEYFNVKNEEEYENSLSLLDALFTADVVFEILDKIGEEK